ncbi:MAG: LysR family transcriptional regulator [Gammaproteobacteria bacterium]|nr:LysR family transcriptional regulator [Gammaproteobacteria bacterium]
MRFVQLRAFHHVCLEGGFSRAAEALHLTQPAISDQISKLEAEYDILLFHRSGKSVRPTAAGEKLLEITHRYFEAHTQAEEFLAEKQKIASGKLRVIADSPRHVLDRLGVFRRLYPGIHIEIKSGNSAQVIHQLREYEADVGILGVDLQDPAFTSVALSDSPLVAIVGQQHPLAAKKSVKLATVLKQPLILREQGSRTRAIVETAAERLSIQPVIAIEAEGREAVRELLAIGAGVGIVSLAEVGHDSRLVAIPVSDWDVRMHESLVCLRDRQHGKLIRAFFDIAAPQDAIGGSIQ